LRGVHLLGVHLAGCPSLGCPSWLRAEVGRDDLVSSCSYHLLTAVWFTASLTQQFLSSVYFFLFVGFWFGVEGLAFVSSCSSPLPTAFWFTLGQFRRRKKALRKISGNLPGNIPGPNRNIFELRGGCKGWWVLWVKSAPHENFNPFQNYLVL